jgi:hypothetical protein
MSGLIENSDHEEQESRSSSPRSTLEIGFTIHLVQLARLARESNIDNPLRRAIPVKAFAYRAEFMEKRSQDIDEGASKSVDTSKLPLRKVAAEYFGWKEASSSTNTVARERALFKTVASVFGATFAVGQIRLHHIRDYQRERKLQASRTGNNQISGSSVTL